MKSVSYFVSFGVGKLHVSGLYNTTKYPILHIIIFVFKSISFLFQHFCQSERVGVLFCATYLVDFTSRYVKHIGVNITAFGRKLTLFSAIPLSRFSLSCPPFCVFRVGKNALYALCSA